MENDKGRLDRQFDFLIEVDKLKGIERQNILTDSSRRENSAEHSWHLALFALVLREHAGEKVDILKVVKMLLIHDLVEIDAGDSFLHDFDALKLQQALEERAAARIFAILPEDQAGEFLKLWQEFEAGKSAEAKFAKSLDRVQPALLHESTDGVIWEKYGTTKKQIAAKMNSIQDHTPSLWPRVQSIIERAVAVGRLKD